MLGLIRKFYNYNFSKDRDIARRLRPILGYVPVDLGLYKLAFYHKSTNPEKAAGGTQNNERLEYLGDAVLGTIVAEYLFNKYPNGDEGFLTKMRSKMVKRNSLNRIGDEMGLDIILQEYNNARLSRSMLGNAVEALVGAVYLELGYERTKKFVIRKVLRRYLDIHELETYDDNYKSQLLEWSQKHGKTVMYKVIAKYKFEKRDRFKVAVLIDGVKIAVADDFNKKSAEQTASEKALSSMGLSFTEDDNDNEPIMPAPAKEEHLN
jgi:ribonuclease III